MFTYHRDCITFVVDGKNVKIIIFLRYESIYTAIEHSSSYNRYIIYAISSIGFYMGYIPFGFRL